MFIGAGYIKISIPYSQSLKEKRAVISSIKRKIFNKFNVSVAEVDNIDCRNQAVLGFSMVANDKNFINSVFEKMLNFINNSFDIIVSDESYEIMKY